jgi:hypothetical protein
LIDAGVDNNDLRLPVFPIDKLLLSMMFEFRPLAPPDVPLRFKFPSNDVRAALAIDNRFPLFFLNNEDACGILFMG